MKTDDLILAITADPVIRRRPIRQSVLIALAASLPVALILFWVLLGPRPDIASALETYRFPLKFVVTVSLAASALGLALRLAVPGAETSHSARWLIVAPLILLLAVVVELTVVPMPDWPARWLGRNWLLCLAYIPLLSLAPLVALLAALRSGAPSNPALAGAVAGLAAGAVGATFYAAHCPDDSPLFVATWYALAIAAVTVAGAFLGARLLRW